MIGWVLKTHDFSKINISSCWEDVFFCEAYTPENQKMEPPKQLVNIVAGFFFPFL